MNYETVEIESFFVAGIGVRTTNQGGQSQYDIGELWGKFMVDKLAEQISDWVSADIYCVYTDYENDHRGQYTAILGCKVSSTDRLTDGFIGVKIPGGKFQVYQPQGKLPDSVARTWQYIWQADIGRRYAADFDLYYAEESNQAKVEIYLGVQ